jgi:hypothetical protein
LNVPGVYVGRTDWLVRTISADISPIAADTPLVVKLPI